MIVELGHFAVMLALVLSVVQGALPLWGADCGQPALMQTGCRAAVCVFWLTLLGFAALVYAHVMDDFSVLNVALNSHTQKPLLYKITGAWASHEGSLLLWVLILTGFGAALAKLNPAMPLVLRARAVGVQGLLGVGFFAFILFTSDPFTRLFPAPLEGNDLNPLLQDPGLAFHPPFLYVGYVGFSSVFALAAAVLLGNHATRELRFLRPFALTAWSSLTLGIALGSWWAYYELGWGGFWFWDPVENAALLPWLAGTALIHSLSASIKRRALIRWTLLLAIVTFGLSLLGTFLVRSGVLTSVHAFAVDPARGVFILALLALAVGGALTLYAVRAPRLPDSPSFAPLSRESFLLLNNLFLCTACATLLIGTLYPLLLTAFDLGSVSVGAPYFNATVLPLLMPVGALMAVAPFIRWRESDWRGVRRRLPPAFMAACLGLALTLYLQGVAGILGLIALGLGLWVMAASVIDARQGSGLTPLQRSRVIGHLGFGVLLLGLSGASFAQAFTLHLRPHDTAMAGGWRLDFAELNAITGPNYEARRAVFNLTKGAASITMQPEQRYYPVQDSAVTDVAIHTNLLEDLYLTLAEEPAEGDMAEGTPTTYTVRFHINPLIPLIWIGGGIMALGGLAGGLAGLAVSRPPRKA